LAKKKGLSLMVTFKLKSGVEVIPTSPHEYRFNDGTHFIPNEGEKAQIKQDWAVLTVDREFTPVDIPVEGVEASSSSQKMREEGIKALEDVLKKHPGAIILTSFMCISALKEMHIREEFGRVLACNATPETQRVPPSEKIWDVKNFAY
jgi:hypothetical protein